MGHPVKLYLEKVPDRHTYWFCSCPQTVPRDAQFSEHDTTKTGQELIRDSQMYVCVVCLGLFTYCSHMYMHVYVAACASACGCAKVRAVYWGVPSAITPDLIH